MTSPTPSGARASGARHLCPAGAKNLPVVFWIHGGGWQTGDKTQRAAQAAGVHGQGLRLRLHELPAAADVDMGDDHSRRREVAFGWVHEHIAEHGGDPKRSVVMGHSAGAQLAALICTDDRYLKAEGLSLDDHQRLRARGWRHLRRAGDHRDGRDAAPRARPAAAEVWAPREVRQRSREAPRLLRRHARRQGTRAFRRS